MKLPVLLMCSALALQSARAELLTDADRETLLDDLDHLRDAVLSRMDSKFRAAIASYRNAVASDEAAIDLYLNCTEKVNFEDQQKKTQDFREWKRKESEKLSDPGLRLALRYQLQWLILTLQAASENPDRAKLAQDAQAVVDSIFRDPQKLQNQEKILSQAVTGSVFARAYEINAVKAEKWPLSPVQLEQVYTDILLPPYQNPAKLSELRAVWLKRIQQEGAMAEFWNEQKGRGAGKKEEKRIGMADDMKPPAYEKFLQDTVPKLVWEMERDLFENGDESGAAVRMLAHLEKYVTHPSARKWAEEFRALITPTGAAVTEATPDTAEPTP